MRGRGAVGGFDCQGRNLSDVFIIKAMPRMRADTQFTGHEGCFADAFEFVRRTRGATEAAFRILSGEAITSRMELDRVGSELGREFHGRDGRLDEAADAD